MSDDQDARTQFDTIALASHRPLSSQLVYPKLALRPEGQLEMKWFEKRIVAADMGLWRSTDQPSPGRQTHRPTRIGPSNPSQLPTTVIRPHDPMRDVDPDDSETRSARGARAEHVLRPVARQGEFR